MVKEFEEMRENLDDVQELLMVEVAKTKDEYQKDDLTSICQLLEREIKKLRQWSTKEE